MQQKFTFENKNVDPFGATTKQTLATRYTINNH